MFRLDVGDKESLLHDTVNSVSGRFLDKSDDQRLACVAKIIAHLVKSIMNDLTKKYQ